MSDGTRSICILVSRDMHSLSIFSKWHSWHCMLPRTAYLTISVLDSTSLCKISCNALGMLSLCHRTAGRWGWEGRLVHLWESSPRSCSLKLSQETGCPSRMRSASGASQEGARSASCAWKETARRRGGPAGCRCTATWQASARGSCRTKLPE